MRTPLAIVVSVVLAVVGRGAVTDSTNDAVGGAQTVAYCEVQSNPGAFKDKMIRVRALYQTDFEHSALTAASCTAPIPMTWVDFEKSWESRTSWRLHRATDRVKWRVQADVVFVGRFRTGGHFGHMDMYPYLIEVYKVEAIKSSGSFRPLPQTTHGAVTRPRC